MHPQKQTLFKNAEFMLNLGVRRRYEMRGMEFCNRIEGLVNDGVLDVDNNFFFYVSHTFI